MMFPTVAAPFTQRHVTDVFRGYDHNPRIGEGAFYHMENLTGDRYPLLSTRRKRGQIANLSAPQGLIGKAKLAYIDAGCLYYGGLELTSYFHEKGLMISEGEKQLVSMGAYLIIYPDKLYNNTEDFTDCGSMEAHFSTAEGEEITYTICTAEGEEYGIPVVSDTEPPEPAGGDLWIDTSAVPHSLMRYSAQSGIWAAIPTVYVKIAAKGIGSLFRPYDGVTIDGVAAEAEDVNAQLSELCGSKIIYACGDDYIVVTGLLDVTYTQRTGTVTVSRTMPNVDYLTEAGNRLWGCKYGLVDGKTVNEIYCCALGDFRNWNRFLGISTDSYVASVGTDGPWTGAVTHLGSPIFFKEHCMHKVYVSPTGAHSIVETACRGVEAGSHKSLAVVGERLLYRSPAGMMVYDGSLPQCIGGALGDTVYHNAVAGALGDKYYVSMTDSEDAGHLFVYDARRGFWHREDDTRVLQFARCGSELYFVDEDGRLMCVGGSEGELEDPICWQADTGIMGYTTVEQKYVSRFLLRMRLEEGASVDAYIRYDSDGDWHHAGHAEGGGLGTFLLPVRPRRCDHFEVRLQGEGDVCLYSFARVFEKGSDEA